MGTLASGFRRSIRYSPEIFEKTAFLAKPLPRGRQEVENLVSQHAPEESRTAELSDVIPGEPPVGPELVARAKRTAPTAGLLPAGRPVDGQQRREVGEVDVLVAVEVAVLVRRAAGRPVVRQELGQVG